MAYASPLAVLAIARPTSDASTFRCSASRVEVALQPFVDNSISKTINVSKACPFDELSRIYDLAYDLQLKGCTTFRPNHITRTVLSEQDAGAEAPHRCVLEREADRDQMRAIPALSNHERRPAWIS